MPDLHGTPTVTYGLRPLLVDSSIWTLEIQVEIKDQPPQSLGGDPDPSKEENNQPTPDLEGDFEEDFEDEGKNEGEDDPDSDSSPPEGDAGVADGESDLDLDLSPAEGDTSEGTEKEDSKDQEKTWSLDEAPERPKILPGLIPVLDHPDLTLREFHSFWSFVEATTDEGLYAWGQQDGNSTTNSSHHVDPGSKPWHGTSTWEEAVEMALGKGWPEGRELLSEALIAVAPRPQPYESLEFSVAGAFPAVPNYCAGDPECMVIDPGSTLRNPKPVVTIDYNNWVHAGVSTEAIMLRGAAVISFANGLEARGISTILRIVGATRDRDGLYGLKNSVEKTWAYTIVFKKAGEFLDLDRAAFAIAHPACMRRLAFALLEQHADLKSCMQGGYGIPTYSNPLPDSDSIYIPGATGGETPDSAREAIEAIALEALGSEFISTKEAA